ncbi:MAG: TIGR04076 family protein [Streptosporangiaceae bacterium]
MGELTDGMDETTDGGDSALPRPPQAVPRPPQTSPRPPQTPPRPPQTTLYDLRVVVERIEGRSVCGMRVGDWFELTESSHLRTCPGRFFCVYALAAVLPLLAAKQRELSPGDWLESDSLVACPDPDERLIMRIERSGRSEVVLNDVT